MKRFTTFVTASAVILLAFGAMSFAGEQGRGGPHGKNIPRTVSSTNSQVATSHVHRSHKLGPRRTIVSPQHLVRR